MRCHKKKTRLQFWVLTSAIESALKHTYWLHADSIWRPETKKCSRVFFLWHRNFAKKFLRFDPTLGSNNLGLKNYRIKNHHIFGIARTSAFVWHMWIPLKKFCKRTRRVCVCIVLVHFGRYSQEVNEKSVGRLSCFIEFFAWFHFLCGRYTSD